MSETIHPATHTLKGWEASRILIVVGAVVMGLGSFMPWVILDAPISTITRNGTDSRDGKIIAGAALVIVILAMSERVAIRCWLGAVVAAIAGLLVAYNAYHITTTHPMGIHASVGMGLWVSAVGVVLSLSCAWESRRDA